MSRIKEKILEQFKKAMKEKDETKLTTIRTLNSAIKNKEIEKKGKELSDEEILEILNPSVKKMKEAIAQFKEAGRDELADKEEAEIKILQEYLPEQLSDEELEKIVDGAIKKTGAESEKDFGKVMGQVMGQVKGRADGQRVNETVKKKLQG